MNHAEVHSHMADYLEADLELTKRALFDAHLDDCERCAGELAEMRGTIALLRSLPAPEPPPFMVETIMRRIREGEGRTTVVDRIRELLNTISAPRIALPATAVAVGLILASGDLDLSPLSSPRESAVGSRSPAQLASPHSQVVADGLAAHRLRALRFQPPLSLPSGARPPGVARAPRVSIQIPIVVNTRKSSGAPRVVTRSPRSSFAAGPFAVGLPVENRAVLPGPKMAGVQGSAFAPFADDAEREQQKRVELERRLERMIYRPALFSAEFAGLSVAEQEIWLQALAGHASREGRGAEAVAELRLAGDRRALELATAFSTELRRVAAKHAAWLNER